eukprot:Gb_17967 [translate_table: standard]
MEEQRCKREWKDGWQIFGSLRSVGSDPPRGPIHKLISAWVDLFSGVVSLDAWPRTVISGFVHHIEAYQEPITATGTLMPFIIPQYPQCGIRGGNGNGSASSSCSKLLASEEITAISWWEDETLGRRANKCFCLFFQIY